MLRHIGIIGAGTMGTEIAQSAALAKLDVQIYDVNETILRRSLERMKANLRKMVNLGKIPQETFSETLDHVRTRTNLPDLGNCDYIIESIIEDLRVKKDLFKHLDANTKSSAVLATTSSSLSITSIAAMAKNQERIIGLHFFPPMDSTTLVEVVLGYKTNEETVRQANALMNSLGKETILVKDTPGFIGTRISQQLQNEALRLLGEHVADAGQIDRIAKEIGGFQTGPFEMMDFKGIDTVLAETQSLYDQSFGEPRLRPHSILKQMVESGLNGKKTNKGFFDYKEEEK